MALLVKKPSKWLESHDSLEKTHMIQDLLYPRQSEPKCGLIPSGILSRAANKQIMSCSGQQWEKGV